MALPELIFAPPEGGTIHRYELIGGKKVFMRFISCYLGNCRFYKHIEDAANYLEIERFASERKIENNTK